MSDFKIRKNEIFDRDCKVRQKSGDSEKKQKTSY